MKQQMAGITALILTLLLTGIPTAQGQQAGADNKFSIVKIGAFKIWCKVVTGSYKKGTITSDFRGGPDGKVKAISARYDLIAPRIQMTVTPTAAPESAQATGGVEGAARDPERNQTVSFSGDTGIYHAGTKATLSRIDLNGNVRLVFRNPKFSESDPLTVRGSSASLTFAEDGQINYTLNNADASGTAVDPPKKQKP